MHIIRLIVWIGVVVGLASCNIKVDKRAMALKSDVLLANVGGEELSTIPGGSILEPLEQSSDGQYIKVRFGEQTGWLPAASVGTSVAPGVVLHETDQYRDPVIDDQPPFAKLEAGAIVGVGPEAGERVLVKSIGADGAQVESWVSAEAISTDPKSVADAITTSLLSPNDPEATEVPASPDGVGITPGSTETVQTCIYQSFSLGDCGHYEFDCGDLGEYNPAFENEGDKQLWNSLATEEETANPDLVGKTFEIRTRPGIGYVCNEGQGGTGPTMFIVGFRMVDKKTTNQ